MPDRHPNIIFIMADDLGYGDVSCNNAESKIPTPNIDRVAAAGIRLTDAHSPSAVCTPTRYGLMTGRYCWRSRLTEGVLNGWDPALIETGRMTLATLLKQRGYATACVGKWHIGLTWATTDGAPASGKTGNVDFARPIKAGPRDAGFDYSFIFPGPLDFPPYCFVANHRSVGIPSEPIDVDRDRLPERYREQRNGPMVPGWRNDRVGPTFTAKAVEWIEAHATKAPEQPFFLYLPTSAPHVPLAPPAFIAGRSQAGARGDMVAEVDWTVGEVMAALDRQGLADDTLLIFTSDNGGIIGDRKEGITGCGPMDKYETYGHAANGPYRGQKWEIYEGGHRIPFVARWPGKVPAGVVRDDLVCLTDMLAAFAGIVDEPLPDDAGEDSANVLPILLGERSAEPIREAIVSHSGNGMFAIRRGPWKAIFGRGEGAFYSRVPDLQPGEPEGQLYDLHDDPAESINLWNARPEIVERLHTLLDSYKHNGRSVPIPS